MRINARFIIYCNTYNCKLQCSSLHLLLLYCVRLVWQNAIGWSQTERHVVLVDNHVWWWGVVMPDDTSINIYIPKRKLTWTWRCQPSALSSKLLKNYNWILCQAVKFLTYNQPNDTRSRKSQMLDFKFMGIINKTMCVNKLNICGYH